VYLDAASVAPRTSRHRCHRTWARADVATAVTREVLWFERGMPWVSENTPGEPTTTLRRSGPDCARAIMSRSESVPPGPDAGVVLFR